MTEFIFDEYVNHLEFLGYDLKKVEHEDDILYVAKHPIQGVLNLYEYLGGVRFSVYYISNEHTQNIDKISDLLKTLNDLNKKSYVTRYQLNDDGEVQRVAFYLGPYNKKAFGSFVQAWSWDMNTQIEHKDFNSFFPAE